MWQLLAKDGAVLAVGTQSLLEDIPQWAGIEPELRFKHETSNPLLYELALYKVTDPEVLMVTHGILRLLPLASSAGEVLQALEKVESDGFWYSSRALNHVDWILSFNDPESGMICCAARSSALRVVSGL